MIRLGVVTGMAAEARCLPRPSAGDTLAVACSGGDPARALAGAKRLVDEGSQALLSFGLAGGLDPSLRPGALIVATAVIAPGGERWETDRDWREAMLAALPSSRPTSCLLAGSDRPIATVADKRRLFEATGACAVDMEGHAVARVANECGLPFAALRAVADPADRAIPEAALRGLGADGRLRVAAVLLRLAACFWEVPGLVAVAWESARALGGLRHAAAAAPLFRGDAAG